jgi:hypothetical protein
VTESTLAEPVGDELVDGLAEEAEEEVPEQVVAEPEPEPEPAPVAAVPAPHGAADWQPSTSLWANRVFEPRKHPVELATWPRPRTTPPPDDVARDYIDAQIAEPARD